MLHRVQNHVQIVRYFVMVVHVLAVMCCRHHAGNNKSRGSIFVRRCFAVSMFTPWLSQMMVVP